MFVLNIIRWFVGYVVFTVEGNGQERFVNLCARFGYTIWNVRNIFLSQFHGQNIEC